MYSIKGAIGHTLGAAGAIEITLGLKTLSTRMVPPTVGFSNPEKGAEGQVSPEPQPVSGDYLLTTNSGFGGVNAALVLGKIVLKWENRSDGRHQYYRNRMGDGSGKHGMRQGS